MAVSAWFGVGCRMFLLSLLERLGGRAVFAFVVSDDAAWLQWGEDCPVSISVCVPVPSLP